MTMQKPISVHTTPLIHMILILPHLMVGLGAMAAGVVLLQPFVCLFGLFFVLIPLLSVGLPGMPAYRLEIYEDGMVYRTFRQTQLWNWSDIASISSMWYGPFITSKPFLRLEDTSGARVRLNALSNWPQARQQIIMRVAAVIYEKAGYAIRRGEDVIVTPSLRFNGNGLNYRGRTIAWAYVDNMHLTATRLTIFSPLIMNASNRYDFNTEQTCNGIAYGRLIYDLWKGKTVDALPAEPAYVVIDGIHFNSEGEMIEDMGEQHA